ncbi:MAG: glycosyltransferase [Lachnospiraceae bacterium]|nr:glycosyltransferase [Lachnospiraceae bacterium]
MDRIAVLIPCFNEEQTIEKVVTDFRRELPDAVIYVYDNNSTDRSAKLAARAGAVVRHEYQQGKGNVVRRMFQEVEAECYLMVDGDDTYPAKHASRMVQEVLSLQADMVVGDRLSSTYFTENKRAFHNSGNLLVRSCINWLFHSHVKDIMTGYRAFSYRFVKTFPVLSRSFEIETEMTIHAVRNNLAIRTVPVEYRDRPAGSVSKLNTYRDGIRVLGTIGRLFGCYRPLACFTAVAVLLLAAAGVGMVPVLKTYLATGLVPQFPTLIVCCFLGTAALISFFTGLQLENIQQKNRRDFEMELHGAMREERRLRRAEDEVMG